MASHLSLVILIDLQVIQDHAVMPRFLSSKIRPLPLAYRYVDS